LGERQACRAYQRDCGNPGQQGILSVSHLEVSSCSIDFAWRVVRAWQARIFVLPYICKCGTKHMVASFPAIGGVVMEPEWSFIVVLAMQHERDKRVIQDTEELKNELMIPVGEIGVTLIAALFVLLFLWAVPRFAEAGPMLVHLQIHVQSDAHGPG
jgi:hypothetical protein